MTTTGSVARWAILRRSNRIVTVTRVQGDDTGAPPAFIVEGPHDADHAPTFHIAPTWREAMRLAASLLTDTIARGGNVRAWN